MKKADIFFRVSMVTLLSFSSTAVIPPSGNLLPEAQAASKKKVPRDLENIIATASPGMKVPVIVTAASTPSVGLKAAMKSAAGGKGSKEYSKITNLLVNKIKAEDIPALAARSDVAYVSLDRTAQVMGHLEAATGAAQARSMGSAASGSLTGTNIGIAILDSGIFAAHVSFKDASGASRIVKSIDFTGENRTDDPYGHGTHVAATAAGNATVSAGAYTGIAPNAKIINVRVLDSSGTGNASDVIAGIDWCIANKAAYNIKVMNLSLGTTAVESYASDPLCLAVRRAVSSGITVCVAAGNLGKDDYGNKVYGGIHSPGIDPSVITVGAANTRGTNGRSDDGVASFSSRGPTRGYYTDSTGVKHYDNLIKPDLVAPGNKIIEAQSKDCHLVRNNPGLDADVSANFNREMMYMSGTSMATPAVAGAAALLLQRHPGLGPNLVKAILQYTAQPLAGYSNWDQGAGLLNVEGATRLAGSIRPDLSNLILGAPLLCSTCAMPAQASTVAGTSFNWGGGIIQKWNVVSGADLIQKYQGIYGSATLLTDGVFFSNGSLLSDATLLSDAALLSDGTLLSDGHLWSNSSIMQIGTSSASGTLLADGSLLADATLLADGTLLSDSVVPHYTSVAFVAMNSLNGDLTEGMLPEVDVE